VGISVFVFDGNAALAQEDYCCWISREIEGAPKDGQDRSKSSSRRLQKWFEDMRGSFPLIGDAHPDDPFGTEYCFYRNVVDVIFASSVGQEGVLQAWKLAEKHGLRLMIRDQLLPPTAPKDKGDLHISALDGPTAELSSRAPNVCFVVFDPDISHVAPREARKWVLGQLEEGAWSKDKSILMGDRLKQWADQFAARDLGRLTSEVRFYHELVFLRVDKKDASLMISPTMELSHKLNLPFEVYVNLGSASS
jgi:hypothetical protein